MSGIQFDNPDSKSETKGFGRGQNPASRAALAANQAKIAEARRQMRENMRNGQREQYKKPPTSATEQPPAAASNDRDDGPPHGVNPPAKAAPFPPELAVPGLLAGIRGSQRAANNVSKLHPVAEQVPPQTVRPPRRSYDEYSDGYSDGSTSDYGGYTRERSRSRPPGYGMLRPRRTRRYRDYSDDDYDDDDDDDDYYGREAFQYDVSRQARDAIRNERRRRHSAVPYYHTQDRIPLAPPKLRRTSGFSAPPAFLPSVQPPPQPAPLPQPAFKLPDIHPFKPRSALNTVDEQIAQGYVASVFNRKLLDTLKPRPLPKS